MFASVLRLIGFNCIFLSMLTAGPTVRAENTVGPNVSSEYRRCSATAQSSVAEGNCLDEEYARQKANLNRAYRLLMQRQDPKQSDLIESAQKAWLRFRELDCKAQAVKGGSAAYNSHVTCLVRLTANRAREMEGYGAY